MVSISARADRPDDPSNDDPPTDRPTDERLWIQQIAQGDQIALGRLYDRYARSLYSLAYKSLGSVEECEELVLDVFAQVWRIADRYDVSRARVDTWLFMITRSRVLDRLRRKQRQTKVTDTVIALDPPTSQTPSPTEDAEISERREQVRSVLAQLPSEQQRVLELAYYQGLSHREIAEQTGLALGTVKTRIRLGLDKLRSALKDSIWDST
jgi:RNA polymerase sigma factor (sigma-70 family)